MPALSLVICIHKEGEHLRRLLRHAEGCYDDLVVVHDGPDETDVRAIVEAQGGRFFERARAFYEEPHWAFAWAEARHDWILRWDADEFPSEGLRDWLTRFRAEPDLEAEVSAYSVIWPHWDGERARTRNWPRRLALINRQRVRHFGLAHQAPIPDGRVVALDLILNHQPDRPTYGVWNTLRRPISRRWQIETARALLGSPTDLPCWRWENPEWPKRWEDIRRHPLLTGLKRLIVSPIQNGLDMLRHGEWPRPSALIVFPLQHWMTCYRYHQLKRLPPEARQAFIDRFGAGADVKTPGVKGGRQ